MMIITVDIDGVPLCDLGGLGFEVTRMYSNLVDLRLPYGWKGVNKATLLDCIFDEQAQKRGEIHYGVEKTRLTMLTRYTVSEDWDGDNCNTVVLDRGQQIAVIHTETLELYGGDEVGFIQRKNEAIAKYFADKPDWRNPLAYWGG